MKKLLIWGGILVGGVILFSFILFSRPSQEMSVLYSIEESLNIPKPDRRSVYDKGCYRDGKNASQYDRRIHYSYGYKKNLPLSFVQMLIEDDQWNIESLGFDTSNLQNQKEAYLYHWTPDMEMSLEEFIAQYDLVEDRNVKTLLKSSRIPLDFISFQNKQKNACLSVSPSGKNFQNSDPDYMFLSDCLGREVCR